MKKPFLYIIFGIIFAFAEKAFTMCPICTAAAGTAIGLSRWLGIDDSITGLWIGGLIVSMIIWTINWLDKKNIKFKGRAFVITLGYYLLIVIPLYFMVIRGNSSNLLRVGVSGEIDKLLLGIIAGSFSFWFGASWHYFLKEKNQGKAYFPFQKVVMPIAPLLILSLIFYFLTK